MVGPEGHAQDGGGQQGERGAVALEAALDAALGERRVGVVQALAASGRNVDRDDGRELRCEQQERRQHGQRANPHGERESGLSRRRLPATITGRFVAGILPDARPLATRSEGLRRVGLNCDGDL